ncbi:MAG TPA: hypothetical protein VNS57_16150 [Steroidobacteraceae bacterium]|nr:hypothetical protein [Steroidobacteraceae bacterium]
MPLSASSDTATAAPRASLGTRIAERLPEIVIEALFMLVAVVLAFAVEEWREERELDGLAAQARGAILQEVARNRDELLESKQGTVDAIAALEAWLEQAGQDARARPAIGERQREKGAERAQASPALRDPTVNLELALLSSAAWRTAQSMEASRRMDYTWMLQISQTYELQALYQDAQSATVEALVTHRTSMDEATRQANARALLGRIRVLTSLGQSLEEDYADIL